MMSSDPITAPSLSRLTSKKKSFFETLSENFIRTPVWAKTPALPAELPSIKLSIVRPPACAPMPSCRIARNNDSGTAPFSRRSRFGLFLTAIPHAAISQKPPGKTKTHCTIVSVRLFVSIYNLSSLQLTPTPQKSLRSFKPSCCHFKVSLHPG
jgi:hypothetical protein